MECSIRPGVFICDNSPATGFLIFKIKVCWIMFVIENRIPYGALSKEAYQNFLISSEQQNLLNRRFRRLNERCQLILTSMYSCIVKFFNI